MKSIITEELRQTIINLYKEGNSKTEIRDKINFKNIQPITNLLKKEGFGEFKGTNRKELNSEVNINKIKELRDRGLSTLEIGRELDFYPQVVENILRRQSAFFKKRTVYDRVYTINEEFFNVIDTEEKAYIIGFICADGYVGQGTIQFYISVKDINILEKIKKCLGSNALISFSTQKNPYKKGKEFCELCRLQLSSVKLINSLDFIPKNKTYNLNSSIIDNIPQQYIRDFLRGYFDGDGNITFGKKYGSSTIYSVHVAGNKEFLENTFQKYIPSTNKMYFYKNSKQCWTWNVTSKERVINFLSYLYKDSSIYLDRKYNIYKLSCAHVKPIELLETPLEKPRAISSEA